jgi:hypothetical protein
MPDDTEPSSTLSVAGVVQVTPMPSGRSAIRMGPSAGWFEPKGISRWENELSVVAQTDLSTGLARALRATLPVEQIAPRRFPMAAKAVEVAPLLPIATNLVAYARAQGTRVHTVGIDRVTAGFYYFAEGGPNEPVHVQGNLVDMLAPSLTASNTNAEISTLLEDLIGRLLLDLSGGIVSELHVELANALPRLSRDGTGLAGTDLESFDSRARALAEASTRWAASGLPIVQALTAAERLGRKSTRIPLFGEAEWDTSAPLGVTVAGKVRQLPGSARWLVTGAPRDEMPARKKTPYGPFVTSDGASAVARGRRPGEADDGPHVVGKPGPAAVVPEKASNGEGAWVGTKLATPYVEPAGPPQPVAQQVQGAAPIIVDAPPPRSDTPVSFAEAPTPQLPYTGEMPGARGRAPAPSAEASGRPLAYSAEVPPARAEARSSSTEAPLSTEARSPSTEARSPSTEARSPSEARAPSAEARSPSEARAPSTEAPGSLAVETPAVREAVPAGNSATTTPVPDAASRPPSVLAPLAKRLSSLRPLARSTQSAGSAAMVPSAPGPGRALGVIVLLVLLMVAYVMGRLLRHHFTHTP